MWPSFITRMTSASRMVERRCATIKLVRPCIMRAKAFWIRTSVRVSMEDVEMCIRDRVCNIPYGDYKTSAAPVSYLLLPATVALAIPLYEKLDLLKENAPAILSLIHIWLHFVRRPYLHYDL